MRIKLSLTLNITRGKAQPDPAEEPPYIFESSGSLVETAAPHPIGFTREPPLEPAEPDQ